MSNENNNSLKNSSNDFDDFSLFNNNKEGEIQNQNRQNNQQPKENGNPSRKSNPQQNEKQNSIKKENQQNEIKNFQKEFNIEKRYNPRTVIIKKDKKRCNPQLYQSINPNINNKDEEERIKKENEEKNNIIRNKLQCFICFGKVKNTTMCPKCKGIACEDCAKKMLSKNNKCSKCKQRVQFKDMINKG